MVSLREFGDDKGDVIHKFYPEEAFELQELGEIPETISINEGLPDEDALEENELGLGNSDEEEENKNDDLDIDDL